MMQPTRELLGRVLGQPDYASIAFLLSYPQFLNFSFHILREEKHPHRNHDRARQKRGFYAVDLRKNLWAIWNRPILAIAHILGGRERSLDLDL